MKIPGQRRATALTRKVQNRIGARALILIYHRISTVTPDPQCLAVRPDFFSEHLAVLEKVTCPVPLNELTARLKTHSRKGRPLSAITFDDGYADNLEQAAPILAQHDIPATVFVSTAKIDDPNEYYWDALERLLLHADRPTSISLDMASTTRKWDLDASLDSSETWQVHQPPRTAAQRAYMELSGLLRDLTPSDRETALDQLFQGTTLRRTQRPDRRMMRRDELVSLTKSGLISLGGHTAHHPVLSRLDPQDQIHEITDSRDRLEQMTGHSIQTFSYPYGRPQHYSKQTIDIVQAAGFTCACANVEGLANRWTDPYQLPRIITGNINGEQFEQKVAETIKHYG